MLMCSNAESSSQVFTVDMVVVERCGVEFI